MVHLAKSQHFNRMQHVDINGGNGVNGTNCMGVSEPTGRMKEWVEHKSMFE